MRVRMTSTLPDWIATLEIAATQAKALLPHVVAENAKDGRDAAKIFARRAGGPHGQHYYKRIEAEQLAPMAWEYGPSNVIGTNYIGAGFRHGRNRDLARSADIVGPAMARDVSRLAAKWLT